MIKVCPDERINTNDILKNKIMVLRSQDYKMRYQLSNTKVKVEKNNEDILLINENIVKLKNKLLEMGQFSDEKIDKEILEIKYKLKQLKFSESNDLNKPYKNDKISNNKNYLFSLNNDNSMQNQLKID